MKIDFDHSLVFSIKSLDVNKNNIVKPTLRFFIGKMLMFSKLSLMSFIYKVIETFYFPNQIALEIYKKHKIKRCLPYNVLTNTDNTCSMFLFICVVGCSNSDDEFRNIKVIEKSKFAQIKDKRFYFSYGIFSFPFSHPTLKKLIKFKEEKGEKIEKYILHEKRDLLKLEYEVLIKNERLRTLRNTLCQNFSY